MRIDEVAQQFDDSLSFDVIDDLAIFMRSEPMFYRKQYLPVVYKMVDMYNAKKDIDGEAMFSPVVEKAVNSYCKKFNIGKRPDELLDDDTKKELLKKLYSEEMSSIKDGAYK